MLSYDTRLSEPVKAAQTAQIDFSGNAGIPQDNITDYHARWKDKSIDISFDMNGAFDYNIMVDVTDEIL